MFEPSAKSINTEVVHPISLSVSIVVYKPDFAVLQKTLNALQVAYEYAKQSIPLQLSLYITDNSPANYYYQLSRLVNRYTYHHVEIINNKNTGYGAGNNLAIRKAQSDYHLVMNPDIFMAKDSLLNAVDFLQQNKTVGLLSASVYGEDGKRHYLCKRNPALWDIYLRRLAPRWLQKLCHKRMQAFEMRDKNYDEVIYDIPFPSGCFMLFRTKILKMIDGFDERFFLYFEDADIGRRLLNRARSAYVPNVVVMHRWSRQAHSSFRHMLIGVVSLWRYSRKWHKAQKIYENSTSYRC